MNYLVKLNNGKLSLRTNQHKISDDLKLLACKQNRIKDFQGKLLE